ncbi:MAG: mycothione reductase [Austwickia sp.]|nr:mycothione reductase [Austwickia sp.]MBK8435898.1 mycothione reductase [Austwickia sp.]MBK9101584.1 mycothione reductase [Austwickia sp.]
MAHYDLVIIGSGSGNSLVTPDFDGRSVAIIESGAFGGTCLNVGCIPTKMFVYAAEVAATVNDGHRLGVHAAVQSVDWPAIRDRIFGRIDPISAGGREYRLTGPNTTAYQGRARFVGPRRLRVALTTTGPEHDIEVSGDQVVIATGSHPMVPRWVRDSGVAFHTSDTVMRLPSLPPRLLILGGGYIACEFAHVFGSLGSHVTMVVRGKSLLRQHDHEVSERFTAQACRQWDVRLETTVTDLAPVPEEGGRVRAVLSDGSVVEADTLLVATGRDPSTQDLGCAAAGVELHPDGRVRVDAYGRTTAEGVWSLGDASSPYQLKHVANHEARQVAHNLVHPDDLRPFDHRHVPSAVFTHPQIAAVGATQRELIESGRRYAVYVQSYGSTAYGWAMEDEAGIVKVLADPDTGELLGAHLMGAHSSSLIQPIVQAMSFGQPAHEVARGQYWIHPALSEVIENALLGLELGG